MRHWLFIITLSIFLSSKPTPVSNGQAVIDSAKKIPLSGAIATKQNEKQSLIDSLKMGHETIATQLSLIKSNRRRPAIKETKVIKSVKVIHDTLRVPVYVYVDTCGKRIAPIPVTIHNISIFHAKNRSFLYKIFHHKK